MISLIYSNQKLVAVLLDTAPYASVASLFGGYKQRNAFIVLHDISNIHILNQILGKNNFQKLEGHIIMQLCLLGLRLLVYDLHWL